MTPTPNPRDYTAIVTREGKWWSIYVHEIDQLTQARWRWRIEPMARDLISITDNIPADSFDLTLQTRSPAKP